MTERLDLEEAADAGLRVLQRKIHTGFPARILRIHADRGSTTVDLEPAVMREVPHDEDWAPLEYEEIIGTLVNVPVNWPRGGGFAVTFPLAVGDWGFVHCSEQSLMVWRSQGGVQQSPGINDPHGLNGCFFVPGAYPDVERLEAVSSEALELRSENGATVIRIRPGGVVEIEAERIDLGRSGLGESAMAAVASLVDQRLEVLRQFLATHVHNCTAPTTPSGPPVAAPLPSGDPDPTAATTPTLPFASVAASKVRVE